MIMPPLLRKLALTVHLVFSIGWIGAVLAYLALDVAAVSGDVQSMRAAWVAMALVGSYVIVPLAIGSLLTGLVMSLGTPWGLFRHYWVLISFLLTAFATLVLLGHMPDVTASAEIMRRADGTEVHGSGRGDFLHAGGGLVVLLVVTFLNVFKPRGLTPYGWRRQLASRDERPESGLQKARS